MADDFSGQDLRGRSFKGEDLRGANFTSADIRGTNFANANPAGALFKQAQAGLTHRQKILLLSISMVACQLRANGWQDSSPNSLQSPSQTLTAFSIYNA
jgi:Pentapeptide repeats (8 copies)